MSNAPALPRWRLAVLIAILLIASVPAKADDPDAVPALQMRSPEAYTSLKRFPQNLGGNFLALFSKKNFVPLLIGGAASGVISPFDEKIRDGWGLKEDAYTIGRVGSVMGGPYVVIPAVAGLLIGGHYSKNDRFRSFTYSLAQASVIKEGLVQGLKFAVGRTRPDGSDNRSFPSGHAANSFMIATVLQRYYGKTAGIIGYSAAAFIAVSRARQNKHWASDLTAGATLGYIVGSSVCRRTGISIRVRKVTMFPAIDLKQRRFGLSFSTDPD